MQKKKAVLFLHGYLSKKESFAYQIPFLQKNFEVFAIDLKGFGENADMQYPYSLSDYVKEVKDYIINNNLDKPHIIAHSFGARIALKLIYENPDICDKLVLTGAAGLKPRFNFFKFLKKITFKLLKKFIKKERLKGFYSKDYSLLSPVMQESFIKIVNERLDYTLPKINNQTLIVFGKKDKETPLYFAKRFKRNIKNSRLLLIDGAGHFPFIDKPFKFNTEVKEFLLEK